MASVKAKQDDLRRLMKERRENLKEQKNRVDSPFAKYNSLGQLFCTICNVQIKSNSLWVSHVAGKTHKENALKKRKAPADIGFKNNIDVEEKRHEFQTPPPKKAKGLADTGFKNNISVEEERHEFQPPPAKKAKVDAKESLSSKPDSMKSFEKLTLLDAYSSSSEDESEPPSAVQPSEIKSTTSKSILPEDFFDAAASTSVNIDPPPKEEKAPEIIPNTPAEALPEGFFDDPVLDAKARNIEYKDPIEEEWERYQKAIAEETNVSKTIIAEDLEESVLERDISQIDEQILQWQKVKELESLAEEVKAKAPSKEDKDILSGSSDEELDEDELLDWRTKSVAKR